MNLGTKATLRSLIAIAVLVLVSGCATSGQVTGDYPAYDSIDQLAAASDVVVQVEFVDSGEGLMYPDTTEDLDDPDSPYFGLSEEELEQAKLDGAIPVTVSRFRVLEVLKGEDVAVNDIIEVSQVGDGSVSGESSIDLSDVEKPVVFLAAWEASPYTLVNQEQGVWKLGEDGRYSAVDSGDGAFTGTYEELVERVGEK